MSSWDAIEVEETCPEHHGLHFFTTWLGRQKAKRDCNAHDHANSLFEKKKNKTGGVNETLISLPLCILSSTNSSSDDVQKLWRFANIIENNNEEQINGKLPHEKHHTCSRINEKRKNADNTEDLTIGQNNPYCDQSSSQLNQNTANNKMSCDEEHTEEQTNEQDKSTKGHSRGCEFHETVVEDEDMNDGRLESSIHQMNKKLQTLEKKIDTILAFVEQQKSSKES